jgi:hypothetical protein
MKLFAIASIAAVFASDVADLSCDAFDEMTYTISHTRDTFLHSFDADAIACGVDIDAVTTTGSAGDWTHEITIPADCADADGEFDFTMYFSAVDGQDIIIDSLVSSTLACPDFDPVYEVTYSFDSIDHDDDYETDLTTDDHPVTFSIMRTDETFMSEESGSDMNVGQTAYFSISSNTDGVEFTLGDCTLSSALDSQSYTFIDMYDSATCIVGAVGAEVRKEVSGDNIKWNIAFDLFRFANSANNDYVFTCNVFACVTDSGSCLDDSDAAVESSCLASDFYSASG